MSMALRATLTLAQLSVFPIDLIVRFAYLIQRDMLICNGHASKRSYSICMFQSPDRSLMVELVAEEMKRVYWISGYVFVAGEGYRLEWLPKGSDRMALLQIALRENQEFLVALDCPPTCSDSQAAVKAFWEACIRQLHLRGKEGECSAFVEIIKSWKLPDHRASQNARRTN